MVFTLVRRAQEMVRGLKMCCRTDGAEQLRWIFVPGSDGPEERAGRLRGIGAADGYNGILRLMAHSSVVAVCQVRERWKGAYIAKPTEAGDEWLGDIGGLAREGLQQMWHSIAVAEMLQRRRDGPPPRARVV